MNIIELEVRHKAGICPIRIGSALFARGGLLSNHENDDVLIVTDENVAPHWLATLLSALPEASTLVLPAGEQHKTLSTVSRIWNRLAELRFGRDAVLVALGGGVVGDMTGFAAACWMRGIRYVQIPTTLLAQVDASVGGKTAVDHPAGKNLVGAFHQPDTVLIDTNTLATLPAREYLAGMAEIVKIAIAGDADFYTWLESSADALRDREVETLVHAIRRSVELKVAIVEADESERSVRAVLNLGHTFAHAIERETRYERFLHGEAVAIGLVLATHLSELVFDLGTGFRPRLVKLLQAFKLPTRLPDDLSADQLLTAMQLDKKHMQHSWRLVLIREPGNAQVRELDDVEIIRRVIETAAPPG